jgi:hypothetical protein
VYVSKFGGDDQFGDIFNYFSWWASPFINGFCRFPRVRGFVEGKRRERESVFNSGVMECETSAGG